MSKYDITHRCGCTVTHNICGTNVNNERDSRVAWLADQPCWECRKTANAEAAAAANADQVTLTGSDKQIAWAEQIREPVIKTLTDIKTKLAAGADKFPQDYANACRVIDSTIAETSASWWIDHRDVIIDARWVVKQMGGQTGK